MPTIILLQELDRAPFVTSFPTQDVDYILSQPHGVEQPKTRATMEITP